MPSRDRATAWTETPCSPSSRMIVRPTGVSAPSRMAGGNFASYVIWRVRMHPIGDGPHGRIDDVEAALPIRFTQSVRVVNMRTGRPAPQAEQGQLAASRWQESRNSPCLPRFHDDQQVAGLEFEIRSIAGAVPN